MKLLSSRDFNRDVSHAKREARTQPVLITDRGQPTHVLMSIADFRRYSGESENILGILAMPEAVDLDADETPREQAFCFVFDMGMFGEKILGNARTCGKGKARVFRVGCVEPF